MPKLKFILHRWNRLEEYEGGAWRVIHAAQVPESVKYKNQFFVRDCHFYGWSLALKISKP